MKNMKTKVIALVLVIPLLLIFTTGSVVQATELLVDVPVTSVTILGERNRRIDIAEEGTLKIETEVLPTNATNAKVTYSAEAVEGQQKAEVIISDYRRHGKHRGIRRRQKRQYYRGVLLFSSHGRLSVPYGS